MDVRCFFLGDARAPLPFACCCACCCILVHADVLVYANILTRTTERGASAKNADFQRTRDFLLSEEQLTRRKSVGRIAASRSFSSLFIARISTLPSLLFSHRRQSPLRAARERLTYLTRADFDWIERSTRFALRRPRSTPLLFSSERYRIFVFSS